MVDPVLYASFLLRFWREPAIEDGDEQSPAWIGEMESIQTGRAWQFQGLERLLPLLAGRLAGDPPAVGGGENRDERTMRPMTRTAQH